MERFAKMSAEVSGAVMKEWQTKQQIVSKSIISSYEETDLWDVKGIGEETQRILFENWIYNQADLKKAWTDGIEKITLPYFAKRWIDTFFGVSKK